MKHLNRYVIYAVLGPLLGLGVSLTAQAELAVIVHPSNPVTELSQTQVQKLFLGRSLMFPNTETKVYSIDQDESSPIFKRFYEKVIQMNVSKLKKYRAYYLFSGRGRLPLSLDNTNEVIDRVSRTENAISYVHLKDTSDKVKVVYTMP
jgi:ABC-type phosphate transport system substrate-binding protein